MKKSKKASQPNAPPQKKQPSNAVISPSAVNVDKRIHKAQISLYAAHQVCIQQITNKS